MIRSALVVFCTILCSTSLFAVDTVLTAPKPVALIADGGVVHVFTDRIDLDYDGVQEDGESPATWTIVDAFTRQTLDSMAFPWASVKANRPALDPKIGMMLICEGGAVHAYLTAGQQFVTAIVDVEAYAVGVDPDRLQFAVSRRPDFENPGTVEIYSYEGTKIATVDVGVNPQYITSWSSGNRYGWIVVNEGLFGQPNGSVTIIEATGATSYSARTVVVGDTPNHLAVRGTTAWVVVNGSHTLVGVDILSATAIDTVAMETSGYDGPRECAIFAERAYVSTYAGVVREVHLDSSKITRTFTVESKAEGMCIVGNDLWVCRAMEDSSYAPDSSIFIFSIAEPSSVWTDNKTPSAPFITHRTETTVTVSTQYDVLLVDITGRTRQPQYVTTTDDTKEIDLSAIPSGAWILSDGRKSATVIISR